MAYVYKKTSANSLNETQLGGPLAQLCGFEIYNTNAASRFVKLWWGAPGSFSSGKDNPTVGTDPPDITIEVNATNFSRQSYTSPIGNTGYLYMATTANAADSDATVVGAGDLIISLFLSG